jgi:hypothetical protein
MATDYHHGVRVVEINEGTRPHPHRGHGCGGDGVYRGRR